MPTSLIAPPPLDYGFDEPPGTLTDVVLLRAEREPAARFVTFLVDGDRKEEVLTFGDLARHSRAIAHDLSARGLRPGDRVLLVLPTGLEFIEAFFGVLMAGMTPVPVYPPARLARLEHYLRTLASITETSACRALVMDERLVPLAGKQLTFKEQLLITDADLRAAREAGELATPHPSEPGSPAFLQFTSGTTKTPRGVLLLQEQVLAQLRSYASALQLAHGEQVASWLPLYHDLGLIGKVLACLYAGSHLVLLSPIDFLKDPMSWLRAISRYRAVHVAAPNFAYELCVRKCSHERMKAEGIDLSCVENSGMGGEPVSWATVERFRAHMSEVGFNPEALNPCYGLAENTLVASGHRRGEPLRTRTVSQAALQENRLAEPAGEDDRCVIVGNGRAFPGMRLLIVDGEGEDLGEDALGEIWVQSPSLASGYLNDRESTDEAFVVRDDGRWLRTGDIGFLSDGDLFICGRQKDLMIVRGRNFHPQDIEEVVGKVEGVRVGNVVAFSCDRGDGQGETAVLVAERDPRVRRPAEAVRQEVLERVSNAFQLALSEVVLLPKGSLPKTSSGKLQRSLAKDAYIRGDLKALAPPGRIATARLKVGLGLATLKRKVFGDGHQGRIAEAEATTSGLRALDPRFSDAVKALRPDIGFTLVPDLRVDSLGLDSVELVEMWLQLEKRYEAKVPEERWSALATLGELQLLLEEFQGSAVGQARGEAGSLLIQELLEPLEEEPPPFRPPPTAALVYGALTILSKTFWDWKVTGHEHLPKEGGFLFAGNHVTYFDGAWMRNALPKELRPRFVAYNYAGLPWFTQAFLAQADTIPIDPEGSFRLAIRAGLQALNAGKALLIFPEGLRTHSGKMRVFRPGVGLLSVLTQKPIVPFRSRGMFQIFPRDRSLPKFLGWRTKADDRLEIRFGPAIHPPPLEVDRAWEQAQEMVRRLREAVEGL